MRKILSVILVLSFVLCGCNDVNDQNTVQFYYPRSNYTQNSTDSVIAPEEYSIDGLSTTASLLDQYLQGPLDPLLKNPFPKGTATVDVYIMGNVTLLTLTDAFAQLEGLELVIACASISRTVSGITGTPFVQISCETAKLYGKKHITITPDSIQYLDSVPATHESHPTEDNQ